VAGSGACAAGAFVRRFSLTISVTFSVNGAIELGLTQKDGPTSSPWHAFTTRLAREILMPSAGYAQHLIDKIPALPDDEIAEVQRSRCIAKISVVFACIDDFSRI
jgi:hypothetical protein